MGLFRFSRLVLAQHVSLAVCTFIIIVLFIQVSSPVLLLTLSLLIVAQTLGIIDQLRSRQHHPIHTSLKNKAKTAPFISRFFSFKKQEPDQPKLKNFTTAIFTINDNNTLTPLNRYANFLLHHTSLINQQSSISQVATVIKPGDNTLVSLTNSQTTLPLQAILEPSNSHIAQPTPNKHQTLAITPIPPQLQKIQQETSLQLLRFIKHELINITTPISSLSEVLVILIQKLTTPGTVTDHEAAKNSPAIHDILLAVDTIQKSAIQLKTFTKNLNSQDFLDKFMNTIPKN